MDFEIEEGVIGRMEIVVSKELTAAKYGSGLIEVFATPAMISIMESTAHTSVQKYLPEGFITLGIEVNIKHLKATPVGMKVTCESKLINVDGRKLTFEVNASDEKGLIGTGLHVRFIVETKKFMDKL
ncbi:MAG: thioesterase family protein [Bacteroidota bacterium]